MTSKSACLKLMMETSRALAPARFRMLFSAAWQENSIDAVIVLFYLRDCRGGKGLKRIFFEGLSWLMETCPETARSVLPFLPVYGSYKDWLKLFGSPLEDAMVTLYSQQLLEDSLQLKMRRSTGQITSLAAKWAPTEHGYYDRNHQAVAKLARSLGVTNKDYRQKIISPLRQQSQIIEREMSAGHWNELDTWNLSAYHQTHYEKALSHHRVTLLPSFHPKFQINPIVHPQLTKRNVRCIVWVDFNQTDSIIPALASLLAGQVLMSPDGETLKLVSSNLVIIGQTLNRYNPKIRPALEGMEIAPQLILLLSDRPVSDFFTADYICPWPLVHWNLSQETTCPSYQTFNSTIQTIYGYNGDMIEEFLVSGQFNPEKSLRKILTCDRYAALRERLEQALWV